MKYVYEHWYNGECFYVGCGTLYRTTDFRTTHRNKKYWNFCNYDRKNIEVKIIETFQDLDEAHDFERALTMYHDYILGSPLTNINTGTRNGKETSESISKAKMGHTVSKETREKISQTKKRRTVTTWNGKPAKILLPTGEIKEFPSSSSAGKFLSENYNIEMKRAKYAIHNRKNYILDEINCSVI